jgi:flagellin
LTNGGYGPPTAGKEAGRTFKEENAMASFSVVSNIASANAQSNLQGTQMGLQKALNRLSSGMRITSAGDDAAGMAVANAYRQDAAVMSQGIRNANDGLSDLQIKDTALTNIGSLLDRLSTLATQAASGSTTDASRTTLQAEANDVIAEITREATVAGLTTQTGFSVFVSNDGSNGQVSGSLTAVTTTSLGVASLDIDDQTNAESAIATVATAMTTLGTAQSQIGRLQNRVQFAISLAQAQIVNSQAAESRIRDANIAEESAQMTRYNILSQAGIAALAQANQSTGSVLALLR